MEAGSRELVLSLYRASFIKFFQAKSHGEELAEVLTSSRRKSTLIQQEVAWRAFQSWLREDDNRALSKTDLLKSCLFLRKTKCLNLAFRSLTFFQP